MTKIVKAYSYSHKDKEISFYVDLDEFEYKCKTCKEDLDHEIVTGKHIQQ